MPLRYIGSGKYCYANSTSMLLASIGEDVPPERVEVLTGMSVGAFWVASQHQIFFDSLAPDLGVRKALSLLGIACHEQAHAPDAPLPLEELCAMLERGPVMLGPLDMGHLRYLPFHTTAAGADHYVLAYAFEGERLRLHDPEGFPHVALPLDDLERAWRAERIPYRRGAFRSWSAPHRTASPSERTQQEDLLGWLREVYDGASDGVGAGGRLTGRAAFEAAADHVASGEADPGALAHLIYFALPLGSRRAGHFAEFLDGADPELARLKRRQADRFGLAYTAAAGKDLRGVADRIRELGEIDDAFRARLESR